ncbi:hypothetical protein GE09DRAFT_1101262 [Coniochaeta sp. 2T2.1]|nr:hypothetical protein GE09DRAFT_1101262 [Coniochaeta sp. 2T2.1]
MVFCLLKSTFLFGWLHLTSREAYQPSPLSRGAVRVSKMVYKTTGKASLTCRTSLANIDCTYERATTKVGRRVTRDAGQQQQRHPVTHLDPQPQQC